MTNSRPATNMGKAVRSAVCMLFLAFTGALGVVVPAIPRQLTLTVDGNLVDICVNGVSVPQTDIPNHQDVTKADRIGIPSAGGVVAVKINNGNPKHFGFVASDSAGKLVTDRSWRCSVSAQPGQGWCAKSFDDSQWKNAVEVALYGQDKVGYIAGYVFSPSAYWIRPAEDSGSNGVVYCRGYIPDNDRVEPPTIIESSGDTENSPASDRLKRSVGDSVGGSTYSVTITRTIGEHVTIYAIASGTASQSSWTKDNQVVSSLPAIHIAAVTEADAGVYATTFSNSAGSTTFQANLVVLVPPVLGGQTSDVYELNVGDSVAFSNGQVVAGNPTPTVTWYKDGSVVSGPPSTVSLNDAGTYIVVAENSAGTAVHYDVVKITPPIFVIGPSSPAVLTRHAGTATTIFCSIHGADPSTSWTVSWTKDGGAFSGNDGGLVFIRSVSDSDAGSYQCTFTDNLGRAVSHSVQLAVIDPAVIAEPTIESVVVRGGSSLCLNCPLTSGTAPVTTRSYFGGQLQTSTGGPLCLASVGLPSVGTYACVQSNDAGDDVKFINVNVTSGVYYAITTSIFTPTSLTSTTFAFQMMASTAIRIALSISATSFTSNNLYLITVGDAGNTVTTVGKVLKGTDKYLKTYPTPGIASNSEYRWYWISTPGAGKVKFGTGSVIDSNVLVNYVDPTGSALSVSYVGFASTSIAPANNVIIIYP